MNKNEASEAQALGASARKVIVAEQVQAQVKAYINIMQANSLASCMVSINGVPLTDETTITLGLIADELDARGYVVQSISHALIGTATEAKIPVYSIALFLKVKGGVENRPRIIVG